MKTFSKETGIESLGKGEFDLFELPVALNSEWKEQDWIPDKEGNEAFLSNLFSDLIFVFFAQVFLILFRYDNQIRDANRDLNKIIEDINGKLEELHFETEGEA